MTANVHLHPSAPQNCTFLCGIWTSI